MSTLLDSLRRAKEAEAASSSAGGGRQVDAILSTLGYARRQRQARVFRTVGAGVVVGLVALLAWVIWDRTASMPEGPDVAADLTVDEAGVPVPAPTLEDAAEPVASPAPLSDPVREEVVDPVGNTIPRPDPATTIPVAPTAATPSGEQVEMPSPLGAPEAGAVPDEPEEERTDDRDPLSGGRDEEVASALGSPADDLAPLAVDTLSTPKAPVATPTAPGDLAPPPVPLIERGPVVSEVFAEALALQQAGDIAGAIFEYQMLLSEGARSAQVHNNLGLLYQEQDRSDDAAREFQRAIAFDPRHSKAHNNLGVVRMRQARYEDAAAAFRDARLFDGANLDAWVNLALALQAAGDVAAARSTLVDALSVDARHGPTHYNLARLFELDGDVSRAVEHYGRFVEYSGAEHADLVAVVRSRIEALAVRR
jgi:Tfp pilus assembly protein PilF|tara:strand:+ start:3236 stop:4504 length:1269 start_codon:yes stop_codon:yes gene_type:complete